MPRKRLGEILVGQGKLSEQDLKGILAEQPKLAKPLAEILLERGLVEKSDLIATLAEVSRIPYLDPSETVPEADLLARLPAVVAERYLALPAYREGRRVVTIMAEPQNLQALEDLSFFVGAEISPRFAFRGEVLDAIRRCYGIADPVAEEESRSPLSFMEEGEAEDIHFSSATSSHRAQAAMDEVQAELRNERTPAVRLVSAILVAAARKGASDIHIEPQPLGTLVRIRVDGMMRELTMVPPELQTSLTSRVKILADLDIAEHRHPQDGRFLVRIGDQDLDLRVSTLPTHYGEKVVMRLLNPKSASVGFDKLGFSSDHTRTLKSVLALPQGMVLVTGPTGSGKSTTLYSFLNTVRSPEVNIITVEDPVEYKINDINQVQVNPKAGLTFSTCLRSILRQDPNVIMVGEIRDAETAEIALQASQTGHLVLSTLHTNDSVAAVTRLLDLGIPGFLVASSVTAIVAQRLVRKLCNCAGQSPATPDYLARLHAAGMEDIPKVMRVPAGCFICDNTGYKGRLGIYELLVLDDQIRAAIRNGARDEEIRDLARAGDMRTMQEDALDKVASGITTLDEIMRVVPFESVLKSRCRTCAKTLALAFAFCPHCGESTRSAPVGMRAAWQRQGGR